MTWRAPYDSPYISRHVNGRTLELRFMGYVALDDVASNICPAPPNLPGRAGRARWYRSGRRTGCSAPRRTGAG